MAFYALVACIFAFVVGVQSQGVRTGLSYADSLVSGFRGVGRVGGRPAGRPAIGIANECLNSRDCPLNSVCETDRDGYRRCLPLSGSLGGQVFDQVGGLRDAGRDLRRGGDYDRRWGSGYDTQASARCYIDPPAECLVLPSGLRTVPIFKYYYDSGRQACLEVEVCDKCSKGYTGIQYNYNLFESRRACERECLLGGVRPTY